MEVRDTFGLLLMEAPEAIVVDADPLLRLALAVYREGMNAASPFYGFLAFWNVIETAFRGDEAARDTFLREIAPTSPRHICTREDVAHHLRENSRNAIAHVIRHDPTNTSIDPDHPVDRARLHAERRWLQDLARRAILSVWPSPVEVASAPVVRQ